jgi:hypothetical protein
MPINKKLAALMSKFKKYKKKEYCFSCKKYQKPEKDKEPKCECKTPTPWENNRFRG